jgi:hypothetical protein
MGLLVLLGATATRPTPVAADVPSGSLESRVAVLEADLRTTRLELQQLRQVLADQGMIRLLPDGEAAGKDFAPVLTERERKITNTTRPSMFRPATQPPKSPPRQPAR